MSKSSGLPGESVSGPGGPPEPPAGPPHAPPPTPAAAALVRSRTLVTVGGAAIALLATAGILIATHSSHANPSPVKIVIDGQDQNISGPVRCETHEGIVKVTIGELPSETHAQISDTDPPVVRAVSLGPFNGASFLMTADPAEVGSAQATKHGNSYRITGNVTSVEGNKIVPFEFDVTCP
jgi:ipoprotein LpqH